MNIVDPALWVHRGAAPPMREFHRHDDLEINVAVLGSLEYLLGGERVTVPEGHTAMFWAAAPHRLIPAEPSDDSDICWIHLPLAAVLRWSLPEEFSARIMSHETVVVPTATVGAHVEAQFATWQRDLATGRHTETVLLEANAMVLRILAHEGSSPAPRQRPDLRPVAQMARFTAENFRRAISTVDIARAANLNPNYATTLFRQATGATLGEQLLRHRIAEAQRLLLTTTMTTAAVAHAAGFGSGSSLYAHFSKACGCSPGAYRAARSVT
ncbi:helix-turn-helix domain-containing protein [Kineococcus rhizosphaerae]|uniref:helix-turn-helix domain-containing protein n=1 Tax=Kineococcus rhizosphaerae TaxID=559628 RepID=UPI000D050392|nr:helix-turn-helix domain-containing protein [Kineococcus rhizosphaerae]